MNRYRLLFVLGCLAVLASLGASQESGTVIQVNCTQDFGCLHLLGQAIEAAPEGATIQLGSGVFYELPMLINKSLTIRGTRGSDPAVIATVINAVQGGALFPIRGAGRPISVVFEDLQMLSGVLYIDPLTGGGVGGGLNIQTSSDGSPDQLKVLLRNSALTTGGIAIVTSGKAQVTLQGNDIRSVSGFLYAQNGSQLVVQDNQIFTSLDFGGSGAGVASLMGVEARFERNRISQGPKSRKMLGIVALGGRYDFIENLIEGHIVGVSLAGKVVADFQRNRFEDNERGIFLSTPPCALDPAPEIKLEGSITGVDNEFAFNSKADLCPSLNEFPWPPGFTKP